MQALIATNPHAIMPSSEVTWELMSRFSRYIDASPKTVATYMRALRQLMGYLSSRHISCPAREDLIEWRDELRKDHKPTTVQNYIAATRLFFRWTAQEGIYPDISSHLKGAKLDRANKKDALTASQLKHILANMPRETVAEKRDFAIVLLMANCALRDIEVSRANIEDMRPVGNTPALYVQGKGRNEKTEFVKMHPETEKAIREYLAVRNPASEGEPLFSSTSNNNTGARLSTRSISATVKNAMKAAGYNSPRLTAHSLRHTSVTLAILAGAPAEVVQEFARHKSINTTMIYCHALDKAANPCGNLVGNEIFG